MARPHGMEASNDKESLIRRLLRRRISDDPTAAAYGQGSEFADQVPILALMGTPEATIVTCVESWAAMRQAGETDSTTAERIAAIRGNPSNEDSVEGVIRDCVQSEHGHSAFLPEDHVEWSIREAKSAFAIV